jgi:hypothetical protein
MEIVKTYRRPNIKVSHAGCHMAGQHLLRHLFSFQMDRPRGIFFKKKYSLQSSEAGKINMIVMKPKNYFES